ncbi:6-phospho-beta-galactosidase [Enterococcus casseliflavus]|jgi:6-phospho-beta-galactosidase|uniref:6-phospho-beta-galactosidase n=1 Tax=Enterococcus casseliflavus TaxID=37734 RepID=UPI000FFBC39F|nr:6-phospho-beta-galactosidase [Enterococcus casseliflavus]RXA59084.1 6-phospho-beta-galactosidase [Enterococcus casseliflavus]
MFKLPEDFIFGGATAAYQAEGATKLGGKGPVAWDEFLEKQGRFSPDPASDFYHQYPIDIDLCHKFGVNAIRLSIAWSRIFPDGVGKINQEGVDFYHRLFQKCSEYKIIPFVTLHHFDTPKKLFDKGDFLNRETVTAFIDYAKFCFEEFKEVRFWSTFNEIYPVATNQYLLGIFPPGIKYDFTKVIACLHNMMYAHAKVVNIFKDAGYEGEIGVVHSLEPKYPYNPNSKDDCHAAFLEDALSIRFLLDATYKGYYSKETLAALDEICLAQDADYEFPKDDFIEMKRASTRNDFLGINHYQSHFCKAYKGDNNISYNGTGEKGSSVYKLNKLGEHVYREDIPRTDWDWLIYPEGIFDLLKRIKNEYPNYHKIYITENGIAYKDEFQEGIIMDTKRIDYLRVHFNALAKAIEQGVNVKGYFIWSLMDVFSWGNGYNKRYGLFYVDFQTQKRYPKASAYWWKIMSETKTII